MSVYSNLDENRINVDKNEIVQDYMVKMANFIAFYRVPNFEELRFSIDMPLYSQLYRCPEGFEQRIGWF